VYFRVLGRDRRATWLRIWLGRLAKWLAGLF